MVSISELVQKPLNQSWNHLVVIRLRFLLHLLLDVMKEGEGLGMRTGVNYTPCTNQG